MPSNYFLTRVSLLQKALSGVKQHRPTVTSTLCWICLQAAPGTKKTYVEVMMQINIFFHVSMHSVEVAVIN